MTQKAEETALAVKEKAGALEIIDFSADAGAGYEGLDSKCFAIPMLYVLQDLSPQVKKKDAAYIEGAEPGMFFNNVTRQLFPGLPGLAAIQCFVKHSYNLWVPRDEGGGFRGELNVPNGERVLALCRRNDKGHDIVQDGEYKDLQLVDTRTHYVLIVHEDGSLEPLAVPFTSTAISESKKTLTNSNRITGKSKPMFSQMWKLQTLGKTKGQNSWDVPTFVHLGEITGGQIEAYKAARDFYQLITSGGAKETMEGTTGLGPDDDIPF